MPPEAFLRHQVDGRIRIAVPSRKGDAAYFSELQANLGSGHGVVRLSANPLTGTLLVEGAALDVAGFAAEGSKGGFFVLLENKKRSLPVHRTLLAPVDRFDQGLQRLTGGDIDLAVALFLGLVGFGLWELVRGNFKTPPWYTAFWYAFGVLTKSLIDRERAT